MIHAIGCPFRQHGDRYDNVHTGPCADQAGYVEQPAAPGVYSPLQGHPITPHVEQMDADIAALVEMVEHPAHYGGDTTYETIKVLEAWMTPEQYVGFLRGNALKYLSRAGKKGDVVEDLRKARFYLDREIAHHSKETP